MLHPSYTDLMKVVNKDVEEGDSKVVRCRKVQSALLTLLLNVLCMHGMMHRR